MLYSKYVYLKNNTFQYFVRSMWSSQSSPPQRERREAREGGSSGEEV